MSVWRRKAIECLPQYRQEIQDPESTIYSVFILLFAETHEAHGDKDGEKLAKYYEYAEWCFRQRSQKLWNAAAVSFYEHLPDRIPANEFTRWVKKEIYKDIRPLLEWRIGGERVKEIDKCYG